MRSIKTGITKEEKIAKSLTTQLSDFTLDLEAVGFYMAKSMPYLIFQRAMEVLESAEYNKQEVEYNVRSKYYGNNI